MKKLQKQGRKSKIMRKVLIGALVTGLTLLPGCRTTPTTNLKINSPWLIIWKNKKRKN